MNYIIDHANVIENNSRQKKSYFIKDNQIAYISNQLNKYKFMRFDASPYVMTPGHVIIDYDLLTLDDFTMYKKREAELIENGCTTVVIVTRALYEREIEVNIKKARLSMINSSIDYAVGVNIPIYLLRHSVIRFCKKKKIPFLTTEIKDDTDLSEISWGWIKEALFSFNLPIYPLWRCTNIKTMKKQRAEWERVTAEHGIKTNLNFPDDKCVLSKETIKQMGIFPSKGELLIGGDVDYNLYKLKGEKVEQSYKIDYDKDKPVITVHKGKLLKAGDIIRRPGFGEELIVKLPGHFT